MRDSSKGFEIDNSSFVKKQIINASLSQPQLQNTAQFEEKILLDLEKSAKSKNQIFKTGYSLLFAEIERRAINGTFQAGDDAKPVLVDEFKLDDKIGSEVSKTEFWSRYSGIQTNQIQNFIGYSDDILLNFYVLASQFYENKQCQDAVTSFAFLCLLNSTISSFWIGMGLALEMDNQLNETQNAFEKSIKCAPFEITSYLGMIRCSEKLQDFSGVTQLLTEGCQNPSFEKDAKAALEYIASLDPQRI